MIFMKKDYSKVNLLSKFNPPYNRFIFFFAKIFMNLSNYFHLKKFKDILVKRIYFPYNNHKIKATYYFKDSKVCSPLLIYIHGGGFAYKEATYHNDNLYLYCKEGNVDILSIDYPLINDKLFKNLNFIKFYDGKVINVICEVDENLEYRITTWFEIIQTPNLKQKTRNSRHIDPRWRYRRGLLIKKS